MEMEFIVNLVPDPLTFLRLEAALQLPEEFGERTPDERWILANLLAMASGVRKDHLTKCMSVLPVPTPLKYLIINELKEGGVYIITITGSDSEGWEVGVKGHIPGESFLPRGEG